MSVILKAENISKQYRLGTVGSGTLSDDLKRWWYNVRGKEDPFLKVGAVNDRSSNATEDYVWALQDIDFQVKNGEVLGIIGKNGAGKSTLLKLLSRVTAPTTGSIKTKGRIASLLEIGTGFHPELTGRENIFMNGAVLGMRRNEIKDKLDEIIAFSGCEKYIDTPVKRYSSGMTVRLGFAVAAHLEPEILVVDEVLAVGDAEFQKKAIGKMQDLSSGEGRTVLFVSHNMASIQNLCSSCILLEKGVIKFHGNVNKAIDSYLETESPSGFREFPIKEFKSIYNSKIESLQLFDSENKTASSFRMGENISLKINCKISDKFNQLGVNVRLNDTRQNRIAAWRTLESGINLEDRIINDTLSLNLTIKNLNVFDGFYTLSFAIVDGDNTVDLLENALSIEIIPSKVDVFNSKVVSKSYNLIYTPCEWNFS